MVVGFTTTYHH